MPEFTDEKTGVVVNTDVGEDGAFGITFPALANDRVRRVTAKLSPEVSQALSEQIAYAREYINLYAPGPR